MRHGEREEQLEDGGVEAGAAGRGLKGGIDGFAARARLVMLVDSMVPEAKKKAGKRAGLATVLGFAVAAALSNLA